MACTKNLLFPLPTSSNCQFCFFALNDSLENLQSRFCWSFILMNCHSGAKLCQKGKAHGGWSKGCWVPTASDPQDFTYFPKPRQRLEYQDPGVGLNEHNYMVLCWGISGGGSPKDVEEDASPYATLWLVVVVAVIWGGQEGLEEDIPRLSHLQGATVLFQASAYRHGGF